MIQPPNKGPETGPILGLDKNKTVSTEKKSKSLLSKFWGGIKKRFVRKVTPDPTIPQPSPNQHPKKFTNEKNPFITVAPTTVEPKHHSSKPEKVDHTNKTGPDDFIKQGDLRNLFQESAPHAPDDFIKQGDLRNLFHESDTHAPDEFIEEGDIDRLEKSEITSKAWTINFDENGVRTTGDKTVIKQPHSQPYQGDYNPSASRTPLTIDQPDISFAPPKTHSTSDIVEAVYNDLVSYADGITGNNQAASKVLINSLLVDGFSETTPKQSQSTNSKIEKSESAIIALKKEKENLEHEREQKNKDLVKIRQSTPKDYEAEEKIRDNYFDIRESDLKAIDEKISKKENEITEQRKALKDLKEQQLKANNEELSKTGFRFKHTDHKYNHTQLEVILPEKHLESDFLEHLTTARSNILNRLNTHKNNSNKRIKDKTSSGTNIFSQLRDRDNLTQGRGKEGEIDKIESTYKKHLSLSPEQQEELSTKIGLTIDKEYIAPQLDNQISDIQLTEQEKQSTIHEIDRLHEYCYERMPGTEDPEVTTANGKTIVSQKNALTSLMINSLLVAEGVADWVTTPLGGKDIQKIHLKTLSDKFISKNLTIPKEQLFDAAVSRAQKKLKDHYISLSQSGSGMSFYDTMQKSGLNKEAISEVLENYNKLMNQLTGKAGTTTEDSKIKKGEAFNIASDTTISKTNKSRIKRVAQERAKKTKRTQREERKREKEAKAEEQGDYYNLKSGDLPKLFKGEEEKNFIKKTIESKKKSSKETAYQNAWKKFKADHPEHIEQLQKVTDMIMSHKEREDWKDADLKTKLNLTEIDILNEYRKNIFAPEIKKFGEIKKGAKFKAANIILYNLARVEPFQKVNPVKKTKNTNKNNLKENSKPAVASTKREPQKNKAPSSETKRTTIDTSERETPVTKPRPLSEERTHDDTYEPNEQLTADLLKEQVTQSNQTKPVQTDNKPIEKNNTTYNDFSSKGIQSTLKKFASNEFEMTEDWAIKALTEIVVMNRKGKQHEVNAIKESIKKLIKDRATNQAVALTLAAAKKEIERLTETHNKPTEKPNITLQHLSKILVRN